MNSKELSRAHERIAELEALLRAPPEPKAVPWIFYVVGTLAIVFAFVAAFAPMPREKRVERVRFLPTPEVVADGSLVLASDAAPVLTKWGSGETSYAIVLGFRHGPDDASVVAFDRSTWKVAWRSAPLDAEAGNRGHITAAGDAVFFSEKDFILLDGKTGEEKRHETLGFPARRVYLDPLDNDWVVVGQSDPRSASTHAEAFALTSWQRRVQQDREPPCPADRSRTCSDAVSRPPAAVRALYPNGEYVSMIHEGTDSFLLVSAPVRERPGSLENAVVLDGDRVVWHGALSPHEVLDGKVALANRRILYSYAMPDGQQRVTARDFLNGTSLYDEAIPGVGYGSKIGAFTAEGDEAFLVANQSLIVIDAKDGRIKKRITTF